MAFQHQGASCGSRNGVSSAIATSIVALALASLTAMNCAAILPKLPVW